MQFQIPQFIEAESKIIGPLSLKQFAYVAVTGFIVFILFFILQTFVWVFVSAIVVALGLALTFMKFNGRKLPVILLSAFRYMWRPKFYLWQTPKKTTEPKKEKKAPVIIPEEKKKQIDLAKKPIIKAEKAPLPKAKPKPKKPLLNKEQITKEQKQQFLKARARTEKKDKKHESQGLNKLWLKLSTNTKSVEKESSIPVVRESTSGRKSKEIFEMFRKITGERETARRVDYR
jgi:outer membrane biosynthesis protein TonB